ncbi:hypothetical protein WDW86_06870 [Bdellovibrionota bacterium FG-2]
MLTRTRNLAASLVLLVLLGLTGCAHSRSVRLQARDDLENGKLSDAEQKLISQEVVSEAKSRFLTLVELGTVAHTAGDYEKSQLFFEKAREMAAKLYTTSVSEKTATFIFNDNSQTYPGLDYEVSMVHYFLVMNNLMMYQEGKVRAWEMPLIQEDGKTIFEARKVPERGLDKKQTLELLARARADVLAWDSILEVVRQKNRGQAAYKDDIGSKILAAYVHRTVATPQDLGTARILYKNAADLMIKSYAMFPTFNKVHGKYVAQYASLPSMKESDLKGNVIDPTEKYDALEKYIQFSSERVTKKDGNTLIILESGMIPEKKERVYNVGLGSVINGIEDPTTRDIVTIIGAEVLINFAPLVLAAGVIEEAIDQEEDRKSGVSDRDSRDGFKAINRGIDKAVGFKFKLPYIARVPNDVTYKVVLTASDGKKTDVPMVVVDPVGDFAWNEVDQKSSSVSVKTGVRVGLKYLVPLITAYKTYSNLKNSAGGFLASTAATAVWIAGKKAVDATESADIRAWNMLPQNICMMEAQIPPGKYTVAAVGSRGSETWNIDLGSFEVDGSRRNFLKKRVFYNPKSQETKKL